MSQMKTKMELPKGVQRIKSKGKVYYYYRPNRYQANLKNEKLKSVKLPGTPDDEIFWQTCIDLGIFKNKENKKNPKSIGHLVETYKNDPEFKLLAKKTRTEYERYLDLIPAKWLTANADEIKPKHILALRNKFQETPFKANYLVRTLSAMFSFSIPRDYRKDNPCKSVKRIRTTTEWQPWTYEQIDLFRHQAQPHIWHVIAMAFYTGQRISDVLKMKWTDIKEGMIEVKQEKTSKTISIQIHPELQDVIDKIPRNSIFILTNSRNVPWKTGWIAALKKQIAKPEMSELHGQKIVTHGIRKFSCMVLAECGCSDSEIQSITGQSKSMVEYYRRKANQKKLAKKAILKFKSRPD